MDLFSWLALYVFFFASFHQLHMFYIHAYGTRHGWTKSLSRYSNNIRMLEIADGLLLIIFTVLFSLRAIAPFLAWSIMYANMENPNDTDVADEVTNGIFASLFVSLFFGICWTKTVFTPPEPLFLWAFIFALFETVAVIVSLLYYAEMYEYEFGETAGGHWTAFWIQLLYLIFYSVAMCVATLRCVFYDK